MKRNSHAFTIVELLVVIVVIAILAAITIVSYTGISQRAIASVLQSDLDNASKVLKMYYTDNGSYPTSLNSNCPVPTDTRYCLKPSPGNTFTYTYTPTSTYKFKLVATKDSTSYYTTGDTSPTVGGKNLLTDENASFEGGTTGGWWYPSRVWNSDLHPLHGTKCLKFAAETSPGDASAHVLNTLTAAGVQYTASAYITAVLKDVSIRLYDNVSGATIGTTIPAGSSGWATVTKTFDAGSVTRTLYISANVPNEYYVDAVQLESGSVATPF